MEYIKKLRFLLDKKNKWSLFRLVFFSVFISSIEVVGISAIMPFIDVATNLESVHENQYYQQVFDLFGFKSEVRFAIAFGLLLIVLYVFRGVVNLWYYYVISHFTENLYAQISKRLFQVYLNMPYQTFSKKNSSYLNKTIVSEASLMSFSIRSVLVMLSEVFVFVFLYILMLFANWEITLVFSAILLTKMLFLTRVVSRNIKKIGVMRAQAQENFYEIVNRVLGNFKHIKLQEKSRIQDIDNNFSMSVDKYAKANSTYYFLESFPRIFLETSGFSLVIILLIVLLQSHQSSILFILPTLSLFVLAMYRLLPSINRIINGYNALMYRHKSIDIIDQEVKTSQENLGDEAIRFEHTIKLENINFSYQDRVILDKVNLSINRGERVAFVGESGSGKSTLVDLIIGLHRPHNGRVTVDNKVLNETNLQSWRSQIGYIPQQVYLFDGTIADNIYFGRSIDKPLLETVLKQANIFDFLQTKQGVDTLVGEGGIQLSGGQKQRVAIARALYGRAKILVLDEATSALDRETEGKIMKEIYQMSSNKTLIIIAHRLSTIAECDKVYMVKDGAVQDVID